MNEVIKAGEVFKLAELLPYQEGKIEEQVFQSMQLREKPL